MSWSKKWLRGGKYAFGVCPSCEGRKVKLKHGFCWVCEDCGAEIARDTRSDPFGENIGFKTQNRRGTYTWGE